MYRIWLVFFLVALISCKENEEQQITDFELLSFEPESGFVGDTIRINGSRFREDLAFNEVRLNGVQAQVIAATADQLRFIVPEGAESGLIRVSNIERSTSFEEEFEVLINMNELLDQFIIEVQVPAASMLVVKDGEVIYEHSTGFYDDAGMKPADKNTLYITSSISKLIVAVGIMQQVELGRLDLDQDVSQYLGFELKHPNFPNTVITTRMLMQHSSGLSNPAFGEVVDDLFFRYPEDSIIQLFPVIKDVITPESGLYNPGIWMDVAPGSLHKNSNYGITLLGYMVEKLAGQHFVDYARSMIFEPIGMTASSYHYPDLDSDRVADHYGLTNGTLLTPPWSFFFYHAGMLRTSAEDWSKFMLAILASGIHDNRILSQASVEALLDMSTPANNQLAYRSNIGLVWREAAANPGWYGHTGAGFVTHITEINPELNMGYIILTNKGGIGQTFVGPGGSLNVKVHEWLLQQ